MTDFDPILQSAIAEGRTSLELPLDSYKTRGILEWEWDNTRRIPSGFDINGQGSTLELDTARITDEMLRVEAPIHMVSSATGWAVNKTGQDLVDSIPRDQRVRNLSFISNHSRLSGYASALGVSLRITAACLQGNEPLIDNCKAIDFGAHGHESFPFVLTGALDGNDRHALKNLPEGFLLEGARISNTEFLGYVPDASNDQVTVNMITGITCPGEIASPWKELPPWRQIMRKKAELLNNKVTASGKNIVQGLTIYQAVDGLVDGNKTDGACIGYYGDYLTTKGVHITPNNSFMGGTWGVAIRLSPTAGDTDDLASQFSHEDYVIEKFKCNAGAGDVYLNADLPNTDKRYIKNMVVDGRLRLINEGGRAGVVLIPAPDTKKKGCNPFRR